MVLSCNFAGYSTLNKTFEKIFVSKMLKVFLNVVGNCSPYVKILESLVEIFISVVERY